MFVHFITGPQGDKQVTNKSTTDVTLPSADVRTRTAKVENNLTDI